MIKRLVIVAGPQAAGKSTFMRALAAGTLSPELVKHLPPGAGSWPQTSDKMFLNRSPETHSTDGAPKTLLGLVFHYNMMRLYQFGMASFAGDPALEVLGLAGEALIVSILPPPARVTRQFMERALEESQSSTLRMLRRRITRGSRYPLSERQERIVKYYGTPGRLEDLYRDWGAYIEECRNIRKNVKGIQLEPVVDAGDKVSFRLSGVRNSDHANAEGRAH